MICNICQSATEEYITGKILNQYEILYFRCKKCGFIQTEKPYWLEEAYRSAISYLDVGLVNRNMSSASLTETILLKWFSHEGKFLDYGGGYGMFVRIMRDKGFNFYRQDAFCENLFAKYFDIKDTNEGDRIELITAFEVLEHLPDPVMEVGKMLSYSDSILFSTEVQPFINVKPETWWYFMMDAGQHVSLYSRDSIQALADRFDLYYNYSDNNLHLLSRRKINNKIFSFLTNQRHSRIYNTVFKKKGYSLIPTDFEHMQSLVKEGHK